MNAVSSDGSSFTGLKFSGRILFSANCSEMKSFMVTTGPTHLSELITIILSMKFNFFWACKNLKILLCEQNTIFGVVIPRRCSSSNWVYIGLTGTTVEPMYNVEMTGMKNSKQFSLLMAIFVFLVHPAFRSASARLQDFSNKIW